jgi:3-methyladenine DNA glycosylase AlkD
MFTEIQQELQQLADPEQAKNLQRFFKTGKGQYGEGDIFLGLRVPQIRLIAKKYFREVDFQTVQKLVESKYHEFRMCGLIILTYKYEKFPDQRKEIYNFYLHNTRYINNWDLVDVTTPRIVGAYLLDNDREILYKLAKSKDLWEKRISILATFMFIRENDFKDSLNISEILLHDSHDLVHKAVGWMLREIGKKDQSVEEQFLEKYYRVMPRTMLRYAIEKFSDEKRKYYMKK